MKQGIKRTITKKSVTDSETYYRVLLRTSLYLFSHPKTEFDPTRLFLALIKPISAGKQDFFTSLVTVSTSHNQYICDVGTNDLTTDGMHSEVNAILNFLTRFNRYNIGELVKSFTLWTTADPCSLCASSILDMLYHFRNNAIVVNLIIALPRNFIYNAAIQQGNTRIPSFGQESFSDVMSTKQYDKKKIRLSFFYPYCCSSYRANNAIIVSDFLYELIKSFSEYARNQDKIRERITAQLTAKETKELESRAQARKAFYF